VVEAASRLLLVAHGPTAAASRLVLGHEGPLLSPGSIALLEPRVRSWWSGPEEACRQTLAALGAAGAVLPALAGPDLGAWTGRSLGQVAAEDPSGMQAWLTDADARPHGGETLAELVHRLTDTLAAQTWAGGTNAVVVTPLVARALTVAALGGAPALVFGLDVGYGGRVLLSRSGPRWRLQELLRHPVGPSTGSGSGEPGSGSGG